MTVAIFSDDLLIVVKCQSNLVIAGSQRNAFKCSVYLFFPRVLILLDPWPHLEEHLLVNLRRWAKRISSETIGANVFSREGNNPEIKLRSKIKN